jgi:hypothetical protein
MKIKCSKCGAFARSSHPPEIDRRNKKDKPLCRGCVLENDAKRADAAFWQRYDRAERVWYGYSMPARRHVESLAYRDRLSDAHRLISGDDRSPLSIRVMQALLADYSDDLAHDFSGGFRMSHQMIVIDEPREEEPPDPVARQAAYEWFAGRRADDPTLTRDLPALVTKEVEIPAAPFDPALWYRDGVRPEDQIPYLSPWSPDSEPDE